MSEIVISEKLVEATYLARSNRFLAIVKIEDEKLPSFLPNPGRMNEMLQPGVKVILRVAKKIGRKTSYDLIGVSHRDLIISVDSRIPNKLVFSALKNGDIWELKGYKGIRPEYKYDNVRFDFLLTNNSKPCLLEVKSCTLVRASRALFPDSVTVRGRKHMEKLAEAVGRGYRACVMFIVQRDDADVFSPNDEVDPRARERSRVIHNRGNLQINQKS